MHGARLPDGSDVVVKVLRPGIEQIIDQDIKILRHVAIMLARWSRNGRRLRPVEVVEEYDRIIHGELDLQREAANASQLKRHFQSGKLVYVPEVHWPLTCQQVMVSERIYGVPVSDIDTLKGKQVDLKLLAERGVEIFSLRFFATVFFMPTCTRAIFLLIAANPMIRDIWQSTAQLSASSTSRISTI